jgi:hypothetical protein
MQIDGPDNGFDPGEVISVAGFLVCMSVPVVAALILWLGG